MYVCMYVCRWQSRRDAVALLAEPWHSHRAKQAHCTTCCETPLHGGPNFHRFSKFFSGRFLDKLAFKWFNKNRICCHTTSWSIIARKQTTNDKLRRTVATYLRCGGVVINQITKCVLLSLPATLFKSANTWPRTTKRKVFSILWFLWLV